jgi:hypothetical protein
MATDLKALLNGTAEAKRVNFASEDFAAGYGPSVIGRVKRRRAVSATAMGGGSLVAVGALTFGAASVPWNSFSPLTPGAATCEPTGALGSPSPTASAAERAFIVTVLLPKGTLTTIVSQESEGETESVVTSETLQDETATLKLVNGTLLQDDGEGNFTELQRTDGVFTITFPSGAERFLTVDPAEGNEPGTEPGHVVYEANGTDLVIDLAREPLTPEPSSSADADCVTPTPSPSATPSALPTPSAATSQEAAAVESPFQCGFEFTSEEYGTGELHVDGWRTTQAEVRGVFESWYGNQAPTTDVPDSQDGAYRAVLGGTVPGDYDGSALDPADPRRANPSGIDTSGAALDAVGMSFVVARDGVVVATVEPQADGRTPGFVQDRDGGLESPQAFMWDDAAYTTCGGAGLANVEIYAVAGIGVDGTVTYAWDRVE